MKRGIFDKNLRFFNKRCFFIIGRKNRIIFCQRLGTKDFASFMVKCRLNAIRKSRDQYGTRLGRLFSSL